MPEPASYANKVTGYSSLGQCLSHTIKMLDCAVRMRNLDLHRTYLLDARFQA
jgi:hypothetical protein